AKALGLKPKVRIIASSVSGLAPEIMGVGPIEAVKKVLAQTGMKITDIDIVELNEAFAAQVLPVCDELGISIEDQLNPHGGAIALGHPFVLTVAVGVVSGVMSAAFGVGGATITTPGIRALGASAFVAVGTTLPSIIPSAVSGTLRYMREGLVDWDVVKWAAPVGVVMSILGSLLSHVVPGNGHWLMILTALLLGVTAWRMRKPPQRAAVEE